MLELLGPLSFYLHAKYASYTDSHFSIIFSIVSLCIFRYLPAPLFTIFIPPVDGIVEGEDSLFYEVWVLGGELFGIEAGNDTEERKITLDILTPKVLDEAKAQDLIKLSLRLG